MFRLVLLWIGLVALTGCTNSAGGPFAKSARVPAPGTYQLRIPSLGQNQPYYTPGQGTNVALNSSINPPVNPSTPAPTLAANQNLNGWTQVNTPAVAQSMVSSGAAPNYNSPFAMGNGGYAAPNYQVATGTTVTNPNASAMANRPTEAPPQSRVDSTRLAATDASAVRTPSLNQTNPVQTNPGVQPQQTPQRYAGQVQVYQGVYPPADTNSNGFVNPNSPVRYAAQPVIGAPGSYQSPYIRQSGTFAGSNDPYRAAPTGWIARDGASNNR